MLWQIHEVNGWFPPVIILLMEQSKNPSAYTSGANDLSFNNADAPKAPRAFFLFGFSLFLVGGRELHFILSFSFQYTFYSIA